MRITTNGRSKVGLVGYGLALSAALILASGCSSDDANVAATPKPTVEAALPSALVGAWGLEGPGIPSNSVLTLAAEGRGAGLGISRAATAGRNDCFLYGSWRATTSGVFVGQTFGGSGECREFAEGAELPIPKFLEQARGFGRVAGRLVLTTGEGTVVATLVPGATPIPNTGAIDEYSSIPELTRAARLKLDVPTKTLPATTPATPAQIEGAWRTEPQTYPESVVQFDGSTGRWSSCVGGPWGLAATGGSFVALSGIWQSGRCNNAASTSVSSSVLSAVYAGFDGDELVFGDKDGKLVGRFVRTTAPPTP